MTTSMRKKLPVEKKSWGTIVAEEVRAKANTFSQEKREQLMERAMHRIYGGTRHARGTPHRRRH